MTPALSIRQPWIELILLGRKTIEVRTWKTKYRGPLLLHSSLRIDVDACQRHGFEPEEMAVGMLLGTVELTDCRSFTIETWYTLREAHLNLGGFRPGLIAWEFANPKRIKPFALRGQLGLFKVHGSPAWEYKAR